MARGTFRFGVFVFDADRLELRREGILVRLQMQPAQVLAYLVEHAGQVAAREELCKAVWGDGTFVDFEAGLNFCISQLRSTLRDDSAQPVYIRTVPKSGYQFIAPVQRVAEEASAWGSTAAPESTVRSSTSAQSELPDDGTPTGRAPRDATWRWIAVGLVLVFSIVGGAALLMYLYLTPSSATNAPILAVARFDNETADPLTDLFADGLTDNVVGQLTLRSNGNYRVIGNAQILRSPPEQRDLRAIAASLGARYIVLGQVQANGEQLRILAHLIRLSDQTHIWVVRLDGKRNDELQMETEGAEKIAAEFAARMGQQPERAPSFAPESH